MARLTREGQRCVATLAERHGFSTEAVTHMLLAVHAGHGSMAQFNHPEFSGAGQWMRGGMLMLSDMFDHALKARVDALCSELAGLLGDQAALVEDSAQQRWWPAELGSPSAAGSQNDTQYAWFAGARRLAMRQGNRVRIYDTGDHHISGVSQQQSGSASVTFSSQRGPVPLESLPLVAAGDIGRVQPVESTEKTAQAPPSSPTSDASPGESPRSAPPAQPADSSAGGRQGADVFTAIERLGKLHADGLLTDEEFASKKAELLKRI